MKTNFHRLARALYVALAMAIGGVAFLPALEQTVFAGQVTTRSIEMSSSVPSASGVSYQVTFTPATSITHPDVIIDFCSNSPIIGDACTATAGTNVPDFTSASAGGSWTLSTIGSNRGVKLTTTTVSFTASTPTTITLTGVVNPSSTSYPVTYYGRILTYTTGTAGAATSASPGSYTDYGGVALATSESIGITAKVMETLSFCVFDDTTSCGTDPSFTIGHTVGGTTIIDSSAVDTHLTDFTLSTNAQGGAAVRLKGDTLKSGGNSIAAAGSSAVTISAGTEKFGVRESTQASCTAIAPYDNGSGTQYGLDITSGTNITTTYGQSICTTSGPVSSSTSKLTWAATAGNTTAAGIYTATEQLIATGTF